MEYLIDSLALFYLHKVMEAEFKVEFLQRQPAIVTSTTAHVNSHKRVFGRYSEKYVLWGNDEGQDLLSEAIEMMFKQWIV